MAVKLIHSKRLEKVVQNCVTGNPEAQRELYDLYSNKMLAVCCRYLKCRMDAEDALHEGFIRLFKKIHLYSGQGSFEGWMRSLFVNVSLRLLEKKNKLRAPNGQNHQHISKC